MIKFGTGGWRAIIGEEFTKENIQKLALAMSLKIKAEHVEDKPVVIGYDRRFLSKEAVIWSCEILGQQGIRVLFVDRSSPTPLIMFYVMKHDLSYGMMVTASHNPAIYNGIKVFTRGGRDADEHQTADIEKYLEQAETLLHVPDYFHFLLTGQKTCEYTEATTGQLVSPLTKDWDYELIDMLGYPRKMFQKLIMPGTSIGHLSDKIREEVGFDLEVVAPATHDTGSAVLAVPANDDDFIYISSGTWSLMGIERKEADCSEKSCEMNFTNEGGYAGRFRYLKNIMGLWMIQSVRHEVNDAYSFAEICAMAEEAKDFPSRVEANDECFLSPDNMTEEVKDYCRRTGQKVPETLGEIATVIYTSLAECYAKTAKELEEMTGRTYSRIHIVGGGSNAGYLNELTAKATKKEIHAGPGEATAIGNITAQMLKAEEFKTIEEARTIIHESFGVKVYKE